MKQITTFFAILLVVSSSVSAQYETGTGTRAMALANNHTALSSGVPDLYWNPGALAFSVTREFQASLNGIKLNSKSTFFGTESRDRLQRFRLNNAGFTYAIPASRGGMSVAGSFSNPFLLDEAFTFKGKYIRNDSLVQVHDRMYHIVGNIDFWTLGFGIQVSQNLGIGLAASIVSGKSDGNILLNKSATIENTYSSTLDQYTSEGTYMGYDVRAGLMYKFDKLQAGARLVFPRVLRNNESYIGTYDNSDLDATDNYRLYSSLSGAWGFSTQLPFGTVTAELRTTLPFDFLFPVDKIPSDCQAGYFKTGGGTGIEVPLVVFPAVMRAGYSYDELDLHPYMADFIEEPTNKRAFDWSDGGMVVTRNLHRITTGIGFTSATTSFDISYSLSTWGITTLKKIEQIYYLNRVLTSFTVRF